MSKVYGKLRQGLAICGDGDEMDSNFHQLLLLKGIDDVTIHGLLAKNKTSTLFPQIQNNLLQTMTPSIIRDIASSIKDAKYLTIVAENRS